MTTISAGPDASADSPGVRHVKRPTPLRESVYEALTEMIIDGTLERGRHLVEVELAGMLGVSRQPVREALQRLNNEGWVDLRPGFGAMVHVPGRGRGRPAPGRPCRAGVGVRAAGRPARHQGGGREAQGALQGRYGVPGVRRHRRRGPHQRRAARDDHRDVRQPLPGRLRRPGRPPRPLVLHARRPRPRRRLLARARPPGQGDQRGRRGQGRADHARAHRAHPQGVPRAPVRPGAAHAETPRRRRSPTTTRRRRTTD